MHRKKYDGPPYVNLRTAILHVFLITCGIQATVSATMATGGRLGVSYTGPALAGLRSVVAWNPCSLRQVDRELDLQAAFRHFDLVLLAGTRCMAGEEAISQLQQGPHHWALRAG